MNLRHVSILVRIELIRRYRAYFGDTRKLAVAIVVGLFALFPLSVLAFGSYAAGAGIASGDVDPPLEFVRAIGGGAIVGVAFVATFRAIQTAAVPANADGLLTAAGHRDVVVSILAAETLTTGALFGVPGFLAAIAFGVGAGSFPAALGTIVAIGCVTLLGTALGLVLGFGVRNAIARSAFLARYKTVIGALLFLGYFVGLIASGPSNGSGSTVGLVMTALGRTPLGWFGDLALIGVDTDASPTLATGALGLTILGVLVSGPITDRLADLLWYETPIEGTLEGAESTGMGDLYGVSRPVARVARKSWIRAWRSPIRLLYVGYPLFVLIEPLSEAIRTGVIPPYLSAFIALYGGWATGAAFTLNPIGDETEVLPITLTTPIDGRTFMAGCCLAGAVLGVPLTAGAAIAVAIAAGMPAPSIAAVAVLGVAIPLGATLLATGVGATFPRLEAVNVIRGRKAVVPSLLGFAAYSLLLSLASLPGLVVSSPAIRGMLPATRESSTIALATGTGLTVLSLGAVAVASYRHAARTFDRYYLD